MKCNMNHRDSYKWPDPPSERDDKYPSKPCPKPQTETVLRCGNSVGSIPLGTNSILGVRANNGVSLDSCSTVVASVALDLSELINPTIKIDFSSLVSFRTCGDDNYTLRLVFKLSRECGGCPVTLGTWTFEQSHVENAGINSQIDGEFVQETDPFSFSWCECEACPDCCRYFVEVEEWSYNIDFATISNISLSALAVGIKQAY